MPATRSGEGDRRRWNERHAGRLAAAAEPAAASWLTEHEPLVAALAPGRALDLACGLGRHALWLAERGFEVDAVDVSDVAVEHVAAAARRRALPVRARRVDLSAPADLEPPYEVVLKLYFLGRELLPALPSLLAPGGLLLVETFTRADVEQLGNARGRRFALEPGELERAAAELEIVDHRERVVVDSRGGRRAVEGLVARRPR